MTDDSEPGDRVLHPSYQRPIDPDPPSVVQYVPDAMDSLDRARNVPTSCPGHAPRRCWWCARKCALNHRPRR